MNNTYTQIKRLIQASGFRGAERSSSGGIERHHWVNFVKKDLRIMIIKNAVWYGVFPIIFYTADRAGKEPIDFSDKSTITDYVNEAISEDVQSFLADKCIFLPELYSQQIPYECQIPWLCAKHFDMDKLKPYSDMIENSIKSADMPKVDSMLCSMSSIIECRWLFGEAVNYYLEVVRLFEILCERCKEVNKLTNYPIDHTIVYDERIIKMPDSISKEDADKAKQAFIRYVKAAAALYNAKDNTKSVKQDMVQAYLQQTCNPVHIPILPRGMRASTTPSGIIVCKKDGE